MPRDNTNYKDKDKMKHLTKAMHVWLHEVHAEFGEAIAILKELDERDQWWADKLIEHLTASAPPDPTMTDKDMSNILLAVAFWTGWLRGERDTLDRAVHMYAVACLPVPPDDATTRMTETMEQKAKKRLDEFFKGLQ